MRAFEEHREFKALLIGDPEVMAVLSSEELDRAFDVDLQLRHVDTIIDRALGTGVPAAAASVP